MTRINDLATLAAVRELLARHQWSGANEAWGCSCGVEGVHGDGAGPDCHIAEALATLVAGPAASDVRALFRDHDLRPWLEYPSGNRVGWRCECDRWKVKRHAERHEIRDEFIEHVAARLAGGGQ